MLAQRPEWSSEVLDFLAVRTQALFSDIRPQHVPSLSALLLGTDWESLLVANLLSSPNFVHDIEQTIWRIPRELRRVQTSNRLQVTHGRIRGRILSRRTLVERVRQRDPTLWVVDPRRHVFQTIPNGAMAGFVSYLARVGSRLSASSDRAWAVAEGLAAIDRLRHTWPLNEVRPDHAWSSIPLTSDLLKVPAYATVWRWSSALSSARRRRDAENLRSALRGWLSEETNERLFELYAVSRTVSVLHNHRTWESMTISLADLAVVAEAPGVKVTVLLDQTPLHQGRYSWLLSRYEGIDGRGRRPDLQLVTNTTSATRTTFIEAKNTDPNDSYGRDSVVKVLGYLKDYEDVWLDEPVTYPRAILLYSQPVRPRVPLVDRLQDEVLLSSPASFDADLAAVVEAHLA